LKQDHSTLLKNSREEQGNDTTICNKRKSWLTTATRKKRLEVNEPGNRQEIRDPTDHIREVPIWVTETIRTVCKETLQSLVTTFTNMEVKIKVIGSQEQQRR
jgi:hypothetical protein